MSQEEKKQEDIYGGLNPPSDWGWTTGDARKRVVQTLMALKEHGYKIGPWVKEEATKLKIKWPYED